MKINKKYIFLLILILLVISFTIGCKANKLSFEKDTYFVVPNNSITPEISISPKKSDFQLFSSNPTIAKVEGKEILALKEGIVQITAVSDDLSDTAMLIVIDAEEYQSNLPVNLPEYKRINFVVDDYIFSAPMEIKVGTSPGNPNPIYRGGYTLNGWYEDSAFETLFDFSQPLYEDTTVYGYWTMDEARFTFESIEGKTYLSGLYYSKVPYTSLELPQIASDESTVEGILESAFKDKTTLMDVQIPSSYKEIGDQAFSGCSNLETVTFEETSSLQNIGVAAFYQCTQLENFSLPNTLQSLGGYAFFECENLDIDSLPTGITKLNQYVFSNTAIDTINLENVTEILEGAFDKCSNLIEVTDTGNITLCRKYAFRNTAIYNQSMTDCGIAYIDSILVGASSSKNSFTVDENIRLIADKALSSDIHNNLIIKIEGNPDVISIGDETINPTMTIVFDELFYDVCQTPSSDWYNFRNQVCTELEEYDCIFYRFYNTQSLYRYELKKYLGTDIHFDMTSLPYEISKIKEGAFHSGTEYICNLKTLTLGDVDSIENYAINNCEKLLAILFDCDIVPTLEGSMSISKSSLANGCVKLYVPSDIYTDFWEDWTNLQPQLYRNDIIEDGLAISGKYVIQYFGDSSTVAIPASKNGTDIEVVCENAFRYNWDVEHIILGENIVTIENSAFSHSNSVKTFEFLSVNPPAIGLYFLYKKDNLETIYIPTGTMQSYTDILPGFADYFQER